MIELYADGADLDGIITMNRNPMISGMTTNPTLMKKAGITDYVKFAKEVLKYVKKKPISFEVFADTYNEMLRQALEIASWGKNVYVKIPAMTTQRFENFDLMNALSKIGVKINATAIMSYAQIDAAVAALDTDTPSIISIFAGRIADTGINPVAYTTYAKMNKREHQKILWASTREVFNIVQAEVGGADIITVPNNILNKMVEMKGKGLYELSYETVCMFRKDALESGYTL